jgi:hypothetical protein
MTDDTRDRVIAMEQKIAHHADILERIDSKLDCVLEKSTARDVKMTSIEKSVSEMAPSVQAVKDGLVFWRVGKYLAGIWLLIIQAFWIGSGLGVLLNHNPRPLPKEQHGTDP